jgi:predicted DNA-binding transcriptional regulator YafY
LNFLNHLTVGFGSLAKALEPLSLVKEIKDDLKKSLRCYGAAAH